MPPRDDSDIFTGIYHGLLIEGLAVFACFAIWFWWWVGLPR